MRDPRNLSKRRKNITEYYDEEQRYLDEAGREFARAFPGRARFLNIGQRDDRDPYVERLFEGFSFLTGRIRQKLDDELPELTQSLLELLWPHFLRPVPSLSVVEFQTSPGRAQDPQIIQRGTEIASQPVRRRIVCRFKTCYDVHLKPIALKEAVLESPSVIRFGFQIDKDADYSRVFPATDEIDYNSHRRRSVRLLIHDLDQPTTSALHLYLTHYARQVTIQTGNSSVTVDGLQGVLPVGFAPEEGLIPYEAQSFIGYRLLQEYFTYPKKFLFLDLCGFHLLNPENGVENIEVKVSLKQPFPVDMRFRADNFRLHCAPIVNLSQMSAQPQMVDHESTEYRIIPPDGCEVYSVESVEGVVGSTMQKRRYVPFYSFKHGLAGDREEQIERYYHTNTRMSVYRNDDGQPETRQDTYISIVGPVSETDELTDETLSIEVNCTNGRRARELKEGDIRNRVSTSRLPEFVQFRNLTQPSVILYPPLQSGLEWQFISHLALNYLSLSDAEAMRGILELYDWSAERGTRDANHLRISGISNVSVHPQDIVHRGAVVRGADVRLEIMTDNFADEGDIYLFGLIMREFLEMYSSVNSFTQLTIVSHDSGEELFKWIPEVMNDKNRAALMRRRNLPL